LLWLGVGAVVLVIAAVLTLVILPRMAKNKASSAFQAAMDQLFGANNYHYQSLDYSLKNDTLVVSKLTFENNGLASDLGLTEIEKITLVDPAAEEDLLAALDNKAKAGTVLFGRLTVDGPKFSLLDDFLNGTIDASEVYFATSVKSLGVTNLTVSDTESYLAELLPLKWQNLSFDTLEIGGFDGGLHTNQRGNFRSYGPTNQVMHLDFSELVLASPKPDPEARGFFGPLRGYGPIQSFKLAGANLAVSLYDEEIAYRVKLDQLLATNFDLDSLESLVIDNVGVDCVLFEFDDEVELVQSLEKLEITGIDFSQTALVWAIEAEDEDLFTASLVANPANFGTFELTGYKGQVDALDLSWKRALFSFNYGATQAPSSMSSLLEELSASLKTGAKLSDLYLFRDILLSGFGRDTFTVNANNQMNYDPRSGTLTVTAAPKHELKDFFSVSSSATITGLTPRVLANLTIDDAFDLPAAKGSRGIKVVGIEATLKNENVKGLIVALLKIESAVNGRDFAMSYDQLKTLMIAPAIDKMVANVSASPRIKSQIAATLLASLENPGTVTISAKPETPVELSVLSNDNPETYLALNISVTANEGPPIYLASSTAGSSSPTPVAQGDRGQAPVGDSEPAVPATGQAIIGAGEVPTPDPGPVIPSPPENPQAVTPEDYWLKFSFLMDNLFGQGNWTAGQDRNYNASSKIYSVSPFSAELTDYGLSQPGTLKAASVEISSPLTSDSLISLNNQTLTPERTSLLFDRIHFTFLSLALPRAVANSEKFDVNVSSLSMGPVHMTDFGQNDPEAPLLSKLRISRASLDNLTVASMNDYGGDRKLAMNLDIPSGSFSDLSLGRLVGAIRTSKGLWPNVEFGEGNLEGLRFLLSTNRDTYISFRAGKLSLANVKDLTTEIFEANDLIYTTRTLIGGQKKDTASDVKNLSLFALDLSPLFNGNSGAAANPSILSKVTPPVSLSWAGMEGFTFSNDDFKVALDSVKLEGPFAHLKIPELAVAQFKGLKVDLSDSGSATVNFVSQFLEAEQFNVSSEVKFVYSPSTAKATLTAAPLLEDPNLFNLSLDLTLDGLSPYLVNELSKIDYGSRERAFFMPGAEKLVLTEAKVKLDNRALAKNFFSSITTRSNRPASELESNLNNRVNALIDRLLGQNLESKRLLASDAIKFVHQPDSLELSAKPTPSLPVNKLLAGNLSPADLNSMAISLSANGQTPVVLRWGPQ
jgi:hypothetical protein